MPTQIDILTVPSLVGVTGSDLTTVKYAVVSAASGDTTVVALVASKKIRVLSFFLVMSGIATARFESGTGGTALTGQMPMVANQVVNSGVSTIGHFETASGVLLNLEVSGIGITCEGWIAYCEI